jgi:hypothetical protein
MSMAANFEDKRHPADVFRDFNGCTTRLIPCANCFGAPGLEQALERRARSRGDSTLPSMEFA